MDVDRVSGGNFKVKKDTKCYGCGELGHIKANCTNRSAWSKNDQSSQGRDRGRGRGNNFRNQPRDAKKTTIHDVRRMVGALSKEELEDWVQKGDNSDDETAVDKDF